VLAPATLAALPSTRAIPDRDVFYVPRPARSILLSYFLVSPNFLILPSYFATLTVQGKTGVRLRVGTTFTVISNTAIVNPQPSTL
jgi:hypothetical protein